jgi:serine/threonine-protein kinase
VQAGDLISDKYRLVRPLGEGGMAEVWSAKNELTQREFAIKLISPALARNREALERFLQEAKATARLRHPNLIDVFDVGWTHEGRPYLVMELLGGESLEALLDRRRKLSPLWTALLLAPIARALDVAHRAGIVHRDLSSANVFLASGADGEPPTPKVLDFGVSKILEHAECALARRVRTGDGAVLGSPAYMSPEQARGAECVDARTDVWSLGVLMYECLCGEPPFMAKNYNALMLAIVGSPHRSVFDRLPRLEPQLAGLIESCLVKDRDARTQTALEVATELEAIAARLSAAESKKPIADRPRLSLPPRALLPAKTLPIGVRLWKRVRTSTAPRLLAIGGAIGGTALGLMIGVKIAERPATSERAPALKASDSGRRALLEPEPPAIARRAALKPRARIVAPARKPSLSRAVAKGLGIPRPIARKKPAPKPIAVAFARRKNSY